MKKNYLIQQFEDKPLSHYAYAIVSDGEMVLIDPSRNPQPGLKDSMVTSLITSGNRPPVGR